MTSSTLYRGSVKDLLGPIKVGSEPAIVFEYTDAYSIFDWGKMPDLLPHKGEALAILAATFFEKLSDPQIWKEYSKTPGALALRKGNRFGSIFNELGEVLQSEGVCTHYLGVLDAPPQGFDVLPKKLSQVNQPFRHLVVKPVSVVKPILSSVLGRTLPDYYPTRNSPLPRLMPLEVVFRMSCPEGSSLVERVEKDPGYLACLGFPDLKIEPGVRWNFPVLELFTKLESVDRPVHLPEALAISGLSAKQLQEILLKTAWVAGFLHYEFSKLGLELADGKLEWAISDSGSCFLVDAVGPDELRLVRKDIQISKEVLRNYYKNTHWHASVEKAKVQAKAAGIMDWKRFVQESPPSLMPSDREVVSQIYMSLANEVSGQKWFPDAWRSERVIEELVEMRKQRLS